MAVSGFPPICIEHLSPYFLKLFERSLPFTFIIPDAKPGEVDQSLICSLGGTYLMSLVGASVKIKISKSSSLSRA